MRPHSIQCLLLLSFISTACEIGESSPVELEETETSTEWSFDPGLGLYARVDHDTFKDTVHGDDKESPLAKLSVAYYDQIGNRVSDVPYRLGLALEVWVDCGDGWSPWHRVDQTPAFATYSSWVDGPDFALDPSCDQVTASWAGVYGAGEWDNFYQSWDFEPEWHPTFPYWQ